MASRKGLKISYEDLASVEYHSKKCQELFSQALRIGNGSRYLHRKLGKNILWSIFSPFWNMRPPSFKLIKNKPLEIFKKG